VQVDEPVIDYMRNIDAYFDEIMSDMARFRGRLGAPIAVENSTRNGLNPGQLNQLPIQSVTDKSIEHDESCYICLDAFEVGSEMKCLPCLHKFHPPCIDRWLARSFTCPLCKQSVV
jgi:E3 ubiquitin-protein ligase RLIM